MKINKFYFLLLSFAIGSCCITDSLISDFKKINYSLETSNKKLILSNSSLLLLFNVPNLNKDVVYKVDTLQKLNSSTYQYIESIKNIMVKNDSIGDNINIPKELLVNQDIGRDLQKKLANLYLYSRKISMEYTNGPSSDTIMLALKRIDKDTNWLNRSFKGVPTIAALANLSKYQNICLQTEKHCLMLLKKHINNKLTTNY